MFKLKAWLLAGGACVTLAVVLGFALTRLPVIQAAGAAQIPNNPGGGIPGVGPKPINPGPAIPREDAAVPPFLGPSAVVVVLKPGETAEVRVVWDQVEAARVATLEVTAAKTDWKGAKFDSIARAGGVGIAVEKDKTVALQKVFPPDPKAKLVSAVGVFTVTADADAKPGTVSLFARCGGAGKGTREALFTHSAEVRVVVVDRFPKPDQKNSK